MTTKVIERKCDFCKKKSDKTRSWKRFCSAICRGRWHARRRAKALKVFEASEK